MIVIIGIACILLIGIAFFKESSSVIIKGIITIICIALILFMLI